MRDSAQPLGAEAISQYSPVISAGALNLAVSPASFTADEAGTLHVALDKRSDDPR
jgi:hypothetical protein